MKLNKAFQRPVVFLSNWHGLNALLDTGALFPVWTAPEKALEELGATLIKNNVTFSGFGGKTSGNLYRLNQVTVGKIIFPEMAIISCNDLNDVPYHMIFSATMFKDLIYEVDDKNHRLNVTVPEGECLVRNLRIEDKDGKLHVLCN